MTENHGGHGEHGGKKSYDTKDGTRSHLDSVA